MRLKATVVLVIIICISLLSAIMEYNGYKSFKFTADRLTYQLFFEKMRNPELWQNDPFFKLVENNSISLNPLYFAFAGAIEKITPDIKGQLAVMQFLLTFVFLLSVYFMTYIFSKDHFACLLVVFFACQALSAIGNRGISVGYPNSWWSRSLAYPLIVIAFGLLYKYKPLIISSLIFAALFSLALSHPPTIVGFTVCFFLLPLVFNRQRNNWKRIFYLMIPILVASYLILYVDFHSYTFTDGQFKEIIDCFRMRQRTTEYLSTYPFKLSLLKINRNYLSSTSQLLLTLPFLGYYIYFLWLNFKGRLDKRDFITAYLIVGAIVYIMVSLRDTIFISFLIVVLIPYLYIYFTLRSGKNTFFTRFDTFVIHAFFLSFFGSFYGYAANNYLNYILVEHFRRLPVDLIVHDIAGMIFLPIFALMAMTFKRVREYIAKNPNWEKIRILSFGIIALLGINFIYLILQPDKFSRFMAVVMLGMMMLVMIAKVISQRTLRIRPLLYVNSVLLVIFVSSSLLQSWELPRKIFHFALKQPSFYYKADNLLKWVKNNTKEDDMFFVDSQRLYHAIKVDAVGFRLFSKRNVIHCEKIGGWAWYINKGSFYNWCQREKKIGNIKIDDFDETFEYLKSLNVDYIVTTNDFWKGTGYKAVYTDQWSAVIPVKSQTTGRSI